jgi:hypothetical protein
VKARVVKSTEKQGDYLVMEAEIVRYTDVILRKKAALLAAISGRAYVLEVILKSWLFQEVCFPVRTPRSNNIAARGRGAKMTGVSGCVALAEG